MQRAQKSVRERISAAAVVLATADPFYTYTCLLAYVCVQMFAPHEQAVDTFRISISCLKLELKSNLISSWVETMTTLRVKRLNLN